MESFFKIKHRSSWENNSIINNLKDISKMHHDYGSYDDQVYNVLDDFKQARNQKEHFDYPVKFNSNPVSDDNMPLKSLEDEYYQQYQLILSNDKISNDEILSNLKRKFEADKKKAEDEQRRSSRNEHENKVADYYEGLVNIKQFSSA